MIIRKERQQTEDECWYHRIINAVMLLFATDSCDEGRGAGKTVRHPVRKGWDRGYDQAFVVRWFFALFGPSPDLSLTLLVSDRYLANTKKARIPRDTRKDIRRVARRDRYALFEKSMHAVEQPLHGEYTRLQQLRQALLYDIYGQPALIDVYADRRQAPCVFQMQQGTLHLMHAVSEDGLEEPRVECLRQYEAHDYLFNCGVVPVVE